MNYSLSSFDFAIYLSCCIFPSFFIFIFCLYFFFSFEPYGILYALCEEFRWISKRLAIVVKSIQLDDISRIAALLSICSLSVLWDGILKFKHSNLKLSIPFENCIVKTKHVCTLHSL